MSVQERISDQATSVTVDDVWSMREVPGMQIEVNEGTLVEVPSASLAHHLIVMAIVRLLDAFVTERDLGFVFPDGVAYVLKRDPDVLRIPDLSFMENSRLPEGEKLEGYWQSAPDLAVEVVSPDDNAFELHDKVHQYLEAGTRLVWVVWPSRGTISVHEHDGSIRELMHDATLEGGDVLPGFSAPVSKVFESRNAQVTSTDPVEE